MTATERAKAALEGVTDGPWEIFGLNVFAPVPDEDETFIGLAGFDSLADNRFVAAARQLVPELIAENEELLEKLAKAVEALEYYAIPHDEPNRGPWGAQSTDFGRKACIALASIGKTLASVRAQINGDSE